MNAYELAEILEDSYVELIVDDCMMQAAALLRIQKYELDLVNKFITQRGEFGQFIIWKSLKELNES